MIVSITGGVMFSSKSICDNMITGKIEKKVEKKNSDEAIHIDVEEKKLKDTDNTSDNSENNENDK